MIPVVSDLIALLQSIFGDLWGVVSGVINAVLAIFGL